MKLKRIVEQFQHEVKAVQGEAAKEMTYESHHTYSDESAAGKAFANSVGKLLNVNGWSALSSLSADFVLHDPTGLYKPQGPVEVGDFIKIELPGPTPTNWVRIIHKTVEKQLAEFTVQPCADPLSDKPDEVEHFFTEESRSIFRVVLAGCTISAYEIGQHEVINTQRPQAGERSAINTLIAEAAWLFYQKIQWKLLTDYLVHG